MTSKFKEVTDNTPQLSSDVNTEAKAQPSKPLASSDNTPTSTKTSRSQSMITLTTGKSVSEKHLQYSVLLKVVLSSLEAAGLLKKYRVLSKSTSVVKEITIVLDPAIWTENIELKVLSSSSVVKSSHNTAGQEPRIPK